jgi:tetratricopeptide (TPR) repeat protein
LRDGNRTLSVEQDHESVSDEKEKDKEGASADWLKDRRVAFVGKLGGVSRRAACRLVRRHGGIPVDDGQLPVDVVVLGADELALIDEPPLEETLREAAGLGQLEVISETQFWQRMGMVDSEPYGRRLYTPAMLAQLLGVAVSVIRRWHRRGLIVPTREVHRLPYFDFQEIATARRLAELLAAGARPDDIERQLEQLARLVPHVERPLAQLSVIVQGRALLLRQEEGLIETGGQMRLDFHDADDSASATADGDLTPRQENHPVLLPITQLLSQRAEELPEIDEMLSQASNLEDAGQIDDAIEIYRVALVANGPRADICFHLAELLYLQGDTSGARERYSMAIELDEDYVEARANLGCILAEIGQAELAVAAFEGALYSHGDYPDAHYHLARVLDDLGRFGEAESHWREFLELAPESPWAEEARIRLQ